MAVSYMAGSSAQQNTDLFPYKQHTIDINGNRIRYIDEGEGTPLLLIHPLPAWSFIYREFIPILRSKFRCIAFDVPGFGNSVAANHFEQTPENHTRVIGGLLAALDLQDAVLYLHDSLGGAGLAAVLEQRQRVAGLVIGTTFAWSLDNYPETKSFLTKVSRPIPGALILRMMMPFYYRNARYGNAESWTKAEKNAYADAFGAQQRGNMRALFGNVLKSKAFYHRLEQRLPELGNLPVFLPWGTEDGAIAMGWLSRFEQNFPNHTTMVIEGAHHFPQEHAPQQVANGILDWWHTVQEGEKA